MWKPHPITDFSGGMVDEFDGQDPTSHQRIRNFLLDASGKPYQRNGTTQWSAQIGTGERIASLKVLKDLAFTSAPNALRAFAYSHHKMYYSNAGVIETNSVSATSWTEALATDNSLSIAANCDITTRCKMQQYNSHVFCSFQNYQTYGTSWKQHPRPRKLIPVSLGAGYVTTNVGLPAYPAPGPSVAQSGGSGTLGVYQYQYVYAYEYSINGTQFVDLGTPSAIVPGSMYPPGIGVTTTLSNLSYPSNSTDGDNYPLSQSKNPGIFYIYIYRTAVNQSTLQFVDKIAYNTTTYNDITHDTALGAAIYNSGGVQNYDEPPHCKLMHIVGNFAYYGGFDIVPVTSDFPCGYYGAIQSSPGVIGSAPGANTIATPDHLTAIESVDLYPIFFTLRTCYRVEGSIDAFGNGNPTLRVISERVGAVNQAAVTKTDRGLVFAALDGLYFTDGFSLTKLTDHYNKGYRAWLNNGPTTVINLSAALAYHTPTKKTFMVGQSRLLPDAGLSAGGNMLGVVDVMKPRPDGGGAVTELLGQTSTIPSLGISFVPFCLETLNDSLLFGDAGGYVQMMRIQPSYYLEVVNFDCGSDGAADPSTWTDLPVVWDFVSGVIDFGNRFMKKWVTRLIVNFKFPVPNQPEVSAQPVYAQITSYNDMSFADPKLGYPGTIADLGKPLALVRDSTTTNGLRVFTVMRRFAKKAIRCTFKQVRIQKASCILFSSKPNGVRAYVAGILNKSAKTFQMTDDWPQDSITGQYSVLGQMLYLANDNYVQGYLITACSADTATVTDPGNHLPANGTYEWEVKGYPKLSGYVGLDSMTLMYQDVPGVQKTASPTDAGANA